MYAHVNVDMMSCNGQDVIIAISDVYVILYI